MLSEQISICRYFYSHCKNRIIIGHTFLIVAVSYDLTFVEWTLDNVLVVLSCPEPSCRLKGITGRPFVWSYFSVNTRHTQTYIIKHFYHFNRVSFSAIALTPSCFSSIVIISYLFSRRRSSLLLKLSQLRRKWTLARTILPSSSSQLIASLLLLQDFWLSTKTHCCAPAMLLSFRVRWCAVCG